MPALWIGRLLRIKDAEAMARYGKLAPVGLESFGGRVLAHGARIVAPEAAASPVGAGVIEFPSLDQAMAFYESASYQEARRFREQGADYEFFIVEIP